MVDAGPDQSTSLTCPNGQPPCTATSTLTGSATNFELEPGAALSYVWSLVSGPAAVQIANPTAASTAVTFTAAGTYTLQLSVSDGILASTALTHVVVNPAVTGSGYTFLITKRGCSISRLSAPFLTQPFRTRG